MRKRCWEKGEPAPTEGKTANSQLKKISRDKGESGKNKTKEED